MGIKNFIQKISKYIIAYDISIDLGTANTLVYVKGKGVMLNEPSVVAKIQEDGSMAFGKEAKLMLGRTPGQIDARRPLKDGVIADFHFAEEMIKHYISKINKYKTLNRPFIIICVPSGATPVDRRAIQEAAENAGGSPVYLVEEPMAAAIGANIDVAEASGNMIIDIGGGTTEIAVISLGGIVYSESIRVGGDKMDEGITQYIKKKHNLLIGEVTAENIKLKIGSACVIGEGGGNESKISIKGRDFLTGRPKEVLLTRTEIAEALHSSIQEIIDASKIALEAIMPELASDIVEKGVVVTGGGALIKDIDYAISRDIGLSVRIADNPLLCVVNGTGKLLENPNLYKHILFRQD